MVRALNIDFDILNGYIERKCGGKEYYLGCWSPDEIEIHHGEIPANIELVKGKNWFALRNGAEQIDGLLFPGTTETDHQLTLFKGYLSDASIHTYSPAENVKTYWQNDPNRKHNGIFSAVTVSSDGSELSLVSDIFGIGPICHRQIDEIVFFTSAPGLISQPQDKPNKISWVLRSIYGYIPGKETLVEKVETIIPASIKKFTKDSVTKTRWYDHKDFPSATSVFDYEAMAQSEKAMSNAIERCAAIDHGDHVLPLTSGCDSRRILAHLMDQNVSFKATTVRMPEATGEDVDAVYAGNIAKDYDLDHTILDMPNAEQWCKDEKQKLFSVDAQSNTHTWSVDFFRHFTGQNSCFYDGIGGDIFVLWPWSLEVDTIDKNPTKIPSFLNREIFPTVEMINWRVKDLQMPVSYGDNRALITSLLMSTKNNTSLWAQQQTKPGHITLCPYFDLEYVEVVLKYLVDEYTVSYPQQSILRTFWPKLAAYPNSRDFEQDIIINDTPDGLENIADERLQMQQKADLEILVDSLNTKTCGFHFDENLSFPARVLLKAARYIPAIRDKIHWWLVCITHVTLWWQSRPFVISIENNKKN